MQKTDESEIRQLMNLFCGFDKKIGRTEIISFDEYDKCTSKSWTCDGPVTLELWQKHINGQGAGLGIVPLREDNTIVWGCIDIDVYPIDMDDLTRQLTTAECPLIPFRSKSGGAHLMAFFDEPIDAEKGQLFLKHWAHTLGFGNCEIFPKQTMREQPYEVGNWLNMPYYNGDEGGRHAIIDNKPATLTEFLRGMNNEN